MENKSALAFLAGLATGAILGVLFAPDKGSKTRQKIMESSRAHADNLNKTWEHFLDEVSNQLQNLRDQGAKTTADEDVKEKKS